MEHIKKYTEYSLKVNENFSVAKSILKKLELEESNADYQKIVSLLSHMHGYIGLFTRLFFGEPIFDKETGKINK